LAGAWSRFLLQNNRLKKLAETIDALAIKDAALLEKTHRIEALRRRAATELHAICRSFVGELNRYLTQTELSFDPPAYPPESFQDPGANLFQINARGRILQVEFSSTDLLVSTENFRVPHILEGAVRCFNQDLLEQAVIEEQYVFYCLEKRHNQWRYFDARTYRSGPFDEDYLISLMEQLV
jgi:hypothetical protein